MENQIEIIQRRGKKSWLIIAGGTYFGIARLESEIRYMRQRAAFWLARQNGITA